jgi:DNA-binding PadR family transcriptional regulator
MVMINGNHPIDETVSLYTAKQIKKRIIKEFLDIIFLVALKQKGDLSGYDLAGIQKEKFNISLSAGTVYGELYSLERKGLIKGESVGKKTIFNLTPKGEEALVMFQKSADDLTDFMKSLFSF